MIQLFRRGRIFVLVVPVILLLVLASLACVITLDRPTAEPATVPPPLDQVISFKLPIFTTSLAPGESIPGTQMTYVNRVQEIFNVSINDLPAAKRVGDSFTWKGIVSPGLIAQYNLRVSPTLLSDNMLAAGPIEFWVLNPIPVEADVEPLVSNPILHFSNIAIDLKATVGGEVPGTSLVFAGISDQGANITGSSRYPYRAVGDSLVWSGRLRGNVLVRYSLRVVSFDEETLRLIGTAELWII